LKEGDEEAAFLVKEADSSEIHPVVFSIPVTTSTTEASGAPTTIHDTDHAPGLRLPLLLMRPWIIHNCQEEEEEEEVPIPLTWST
jgi:hypothetical protein